ncbi:MAG: hypothetical protein RJA70_2895 [Pseudomonadota bacterium]|jgi:general secretion pathway protein G
MSALSLRAKWIETRKRHAGVTLVEVLIVVAIMAMLAGGVAFAVLPRMAETRVKTAKQGAQQIRSIVQIWQTENGAECPSLSQLKKDGFMDKGGNTDDPWNTPFSLKCTGEDIVVSSSGPDKKRGTQDDIVVPEEGGGGDDQAEPSE